MATARPKGRGYEIRVFIGYDMNGKKICKSRTWIPEQNMTTKQVEKELERQKFLYEQEIKSGKSINGNVKFQNFAERWLAEYAQNQLAPKTFTRYKDYLKRIYPAIGHIRIKDINPQHLNAFYRNLSEAGMNKNVRHDAKGKIIGDARLAPKTILDHHRLISIILATAVKWQIIDKNVASRADPPKVPYKEINYLDELEIKKLIAALENKPIHYRTMIILLIYTGMRRGELFGLEWKDIDFQKETISIIRTSQYLGNKTLITKEPKTKSGQRTMTVGKSVCHLLKEYQKWQLKEKLKLGDRWIETDRLFTTWNGTPMHPDTLSGWFSDFIKNNGFRKVTLHSLRHTNATLMIADGTDVRTVSNRLGHAQTSTTLNIYAHALSSKDKDAAKNLDLILKIS